jgi:acyl-homoserine lactone acylase PvdQ
VGVLLCALALAAPASAAVEPYGAHDARGFRNVLPPGAKGTANATDLAAYLTTNTYPEHWRDQQPLYDGLLLAEPTLTGKDIPDYFKDATFGVRPGDVESTITPRAGVTIQRDAGYGVPHIYGDTRADAMFGAGYANAQDRLFLMDILRHTGRAELSSFIGGSPSNRAMDRSQWQFAPYTDGELSRQFALADDYYGKEGRQLQRDAQAYIDGVNAYIQDALSDPSLLPAEYAAIGKLPQPWDVSDLVAEASLIGGIFGKGGGRELDSSLVLRALQRRFGAKAGRRVWSDFRSKNDPEAPTTVAKRFPYQTTSPFAKRGLAIPAPGSVKDAPVAPPVSSRQVNSADPEYAGLAALGANLVAAIRRDLHASNWELVSARESATGHPLGVLGPQVGYFEPQVLMEMDIHGPGIDARGATFPGVGLYVLLGHGRDYAWSATTATSDNVDTFAEVLCRDNFHYRWRGKCRPMKKLVRENAWTPNAVDDTPPGSETLTAYRTVHGIVTARGRVGARKVAFVTSRSTYFHEADSALFFKRLNDPRFMRDGPKSFYRAATKMNFAFNWSYIDAKHIAYQLTGWYPKRAPGTSPDFPVLGTGAFDWQGFDPRADRHDADWLPQRKHPHAVDPPFLVSWNNKQAPGWAAADDQYAYSALHRSQMISDRVRAGTRGKRKMTLAQLVRAMEKPATQDLRGYRLLPLLLKALGKPGGELGKAVATLRSWRRAGSHRRDLNGDDSYEHERAVILMDAWWPRLVKAEFRPALGKTAFEKLLTMIGDGDHTDGAPTAPDYFDGWWGYASKDLRTVFGDGARGWSRAYCGGGSPKRCRAALRGSLRKALDVTPAELYGRGACESDPDPECFDRNRPTVASGIEIGTYPFQNRPTFQQVVALEKGVR